MTVLSLFATVFGIIFIAELPDKTALAALVLATRHRPAPVFLGAGLALTVQSGIAVAAGTLLSKIDPHWVEIGTGAVFLVCAVLMWIRHEDPEKVKDRAAKGFWAAFGTTFGVLFLAEWGDLTQVGTAALQAKYHDWPVVFGASACALWAVAALAVFVGNKAGKLLDPHVTQKIAAVIFAVVGVVLLIKAF